MNDRKVPSAEDYAALFTATREAGKADAEALRPAIVLAAKLDVLENELYPMLVAMHQSSGVRAARTAVRALTTQLKREFLDLKPEAEAELEANRKKRNSWELSVISRVEQAISETSAGEDVYEAIDALGARIERGE